MMEKDINFQIYCVADDTTFCNCYLIDCMLAASMPLTKHLNVAIIDSNPALVGKTCIKKEDPPDPRVSTVTPATISLFKGTKFNSFLILQYVLQELQVKDLNSSFKKKKKKSSIQ